MLIRVTSILSPIYNLNQCQCFGNYILTNIFQWNFIKKKNINVSLKTHLNMLSVPKCFKRNFCTFSSMFALGETSDLWLMLFSNWAIWGYFLRIWNQNLASMGTQSNWKSLCYLISVSVGVFCAQLQGCPKTWLITTILSYWLFKVNHNCYLRFLLLA